uniref:CobW C-terminal domain-containing protein n=1 Tax=Octactis speculum TaxID=3111310 RepID=A0A7S2AW62_9STRA|mmetsp:Transcript_16677/g.22399  ORF Transcript_16677/g.22399 Transcript_16677/m.22399 type:complete len:375 (+) Transcript_16677:31-1155(+)|eukprot:CAMPEP_0185767538 /NCGR_PEP_ID=MMETSP1174-20130828/44627_1 /TAXON_ID=35687 /ORGANISM="Dictyocha speculum, Strain CCMP1381" /LENGTH=374 /DNA_ID=CAMNT_0028451803 /DNA_START=26 /DNA_END=1150 /DNA_ORIENTATION=+
MAAMTGGGPGRTSVSILTGFLGAGKTTLVNQILTAKHGLRIAVIENEFGEIGVDDALVMETEEEVFEMNNGCVCCTVRGDLLRIFERLSRRPKFDHIIIETTGLADPAPVAQTFFVDETVKANFELDAIITVVDAAHVSPHLDEEKPEGVENESVEQVAFADRILLNKVDLVTDAEKEAVIEKIRSINKFCEIIETTHADVDINRVVGIKAFDLDRVLAVEEDFLDTEGEHMHDLSVSSVGCQFEGELDLDKLNAFLTRLLQEKGVDIFRSKGVLSIAGSDARFVFQAVHMLMGFSSSDEGVGRPWKENEPRINRIIFIGRNLDREELTSKFVACLADPSQSETAMESLQAARAAAAAKTAESLAMTGAAEKSQ